jgi:DNA invertase Pin-like site-specific DNA recombinase
MDQNTALPAKAYSYLRFSTPEQQKGDSFRRQTALAANYARKHGLELDDKLTYRDLGVSAYRGLNMATGRLGEFMQAVQAEEVPRGSFLLVESLDRISRQDAIYAQHLLTQIVLSGVRVVTLLDEKEYSEETLTKDPTSLIFSIVYFMRGNDESATKSRRLKQAWEAKRAIAATKPLTSRAPAWLRLDRPNSCFQLIPERAALVRRIYALTLDGIGQHKITETFNREGLKPWGRAKHWQSSYIAKILGNPAVIGTMTPHVTEHDGAVKRRRALEPLEDYYPAAVSRDTWSDVRALKEAGAATRGRPAAAPISNILAGLAACPVCGETMTRVQKGRKSSPYYVCRRAKAGAGCQYKSVRCDWVEDALMWRLPPRLESSEGVGSNDALGQEIANADHLVDHLKERASNLLDNLSHERSPSLAARLRETEDELEEAQGRLGALLERREVASGPLVASRITRALEALQPGEGPMQPALVNLALRGIFKRAVINWPQGTVDLEWTHGGLCIVPFMWGRPPVTLPKKGS